VRLAVAAVVLVAVAGAAAHAAVPGAKAPDTTDTRASRMTSRFVAMLMTGGGKHPAIPLAQVQRAARTVETRATRAGWKLAPLRRFTAAGGALVVIVRLDDRTLLGGLANAFRTTLVLQLPVRHTLLLIEGPDGVLVGGGASYRDWVYGAVLDRAHPPAAASIPGWLALGPTDLQVTVFRSMRWGRPPTFRLSCGILRPNPATPAATCAKLLRERSVLFSPIQNDITCPGGESDRVSIDGLVGGIPVERLYGNCTPGVAQAWEDLLRA
jgi:hypothetical protein